MGDITNFTVNDDGSVTVANGSTGSKSTNKHEANILDIFRIEKAKGGLFASRRMKKRALKYAKQANVPEHIVEKLMLDNYPSEFACYPKTTKLISWISIIVLFLLGVIILAFPTYDEFERYSRKNEIYKAFHDRRENKFETYAGGAVDEYFANMSIEEYNRQLNNAKKYRDYHLSDFLYFLYADLACLLIAGVGIWQYRKVRKSIIETTTKQLDNG
ncbi:MAG: hypothetical protein NC082_04040 [Clostridiales bacterium]|nr:hypothetical protein [Clostridiales bacterium]